MVTKIIHLLWNQRRMNGWIFMELVVVSIFLWTVIDPIYVLTATGLIDKGYDSRGRYVVKIGTYDVSNGNYRKEMATDSLCKEAYNRIIRKVRDMPELKNFAVVSSASFPNSDSWNGTQVYGDTADIKMDKFVHTQYYDCMAQDGSNIFRTYGMKDAITGGELEIPVDAAVRNKVFLSESLARALWGKVDVVGQHVYMHNRPACEVAGVFDDFKHRNYEQPYLLLVEVSDEVQGSIYMNWGYSLVISLKDEVKADVFEQRFRKEVIPELVAGNFYCSGLQSFDEVSYLYAQKSGIINQFRLKYSLAGFSLLCIFLGMVGTFWMRCNARRQEIGLMRSLGASTNRICMQFLLEAWLLVTVAFVVALPIIVHLVHESGLVTSSSGAGMAELNMEYWQNRPIVHFCIVMLITYVVLLIVGLIGTYIPARRASYMLPADALREE